MVRVRDECRGRPRGTVPGEVVLDGNLTPRETLAALRRHIGPVPARP